MGEEKGTDEVGKADDGEWTDEAEEIGDEERTDDKEETNDGRVENTGEEHRREFNFRRGQFRRGECGEGYSQDPEKADIGTNCRTIHVSLSWKAEATELSDQCEKTSHKFQYVRSGTCDGTRCLHKL